MGETSVAMAAAVPRGKRMTFLVEKCAELGVEELRPVRWARSPRSGSAPASALERWQRLAASAAKQARRAGLMTVLAPVSPAELAGALADFDRVLYLDTAGGVSPRAALEGLAPGARLLVLVGPEGGMVPGDLAVLEASVKLRRVTLGPGVLRVETAAVAAAAAVLAEGLSFRNE